MSASLRSGLGIALLVLAPCQACSQGTARSMDIDTSIRAAGMGGASTGVVWGAPNAWSNPASLGAMSGLWVEHGRTQLVPGLATDVFFRSDRFLVGGNGIGFAFTGEPDHLGGVDLNYGVSDQTDASGGVIGSFSSFESVDGASIGLSFPRLLDRLMALRGSSLHLSDVVDLSAGWSRKHTVIALAPTVIGGVAAGDTRDWGMLARLSPLQLLPASPEGERGLREVLLFDLGWGRSVLNANDEQFRFLNEDVSSPPTRMKRSGFSARVGARLPRPLVVHGLSPLWPALSPQLTIGYASDHEDNDAGGTGRYRYEVDRDGFEVSLANIFTWRRGYVEDRKGEIIGDTHGWGIGLPLGPWALLRMDRATIPQARNSGLPDVKRSGWYAWVDPIRIYEDLSKAGE